jgi:nitrate/nitrite transporter NarK
MDCMLPVSWAVCLDVGRTYAGTVGGTMNMAGQLGSFFSSVIFGYLVTWFGSYNAPLFPMAAMLVVSAVFFARIDPTEQIIDVPAGSSGFPGAFGPGRDAASLVSQ